MRHRTHFGTVHMLAALAVAAVVVLALGPPAAQAQNNIALAASVNSNCTITVNVDVGAASLPIDTAGAQRVQVGNVDQHCNVKAGYTLSVTSAHCSGGALLLGTGATPDSLNYSVEFDNPGDTQTGLLASTCTAATGRDVTGVVGNDNSTIWVNFTGNPLIAADTYDDTLTITMTTK
jgi:spore coat protein U-like protein